MCALLRVLQNDNNFPSWKITKMRLLPINPISFSCFMNSNATSQQGKATELLFWNYRSFQEQ